MAVRPVKIKISGWSKTPSRKEAIELFGEDELLGDAFGGETSENSSDIDRIVIETEGVMCREKGVTRVIYNDPQPWIKGGKTELVFDNAAPTTVCMLAEAGIGTALVFDNEKRRQVCIGNNGPISYEFTVCTDKLENGITYENGGSLTVVYKIELRGVSVEHTNTVLTVTPVG